MTEQHTLRVFDADLKELNREVINLATQVKEEMERAITALVQGDHAAADEVIASDRAVDDLHSRIAAHTTRTLARQQPMADDLRTILAAARIASHLERIGDYAKNTAKRGKRLSAPIDANVSAQFRWMGARVSTMLRRAIDAYANHDAELANVAWSDDAELDATYAKLFEHLLGAMRNGRTGTDDGVQLLFVAKGLERAGDHVTDIAEEIYLMVSGKVLQGPRPKVDELGTTDCSRD